MLWYYILEWAKVISAVLLIGSVTVLPTWIVAYRQGYAVGRADGAAIARRERERA